MSIGDSIITDYGIFYNTKVESDNLSIFNGLQFTVEDETDYVIPTNVIISLDVEVVAYCNAFYNYISKLYKTQDVRFDFIDNAEDGAIKSLHVTGLSMGSVIGNIAMSDGNTYHLEALAGEELPDWTGDPAALCFSLIKN